MAITKKEHPVTWEQVWAAVGTLFVLGLIVGILMLSYNVGKNDGHSVYIKCDGPNSFGMNGIQFDAGRITESYIVENCHDQFMAEKR